LGGSCASLLCHTMEVTTTVVPIAVAYFLGAIPTGLIIARLFGIRDIREHGSGNICATNVWRVIGPRAAVWVYVFDIGKGVAAVMIARQFDQTLVDRDLFLVICAVMAVLGNIVSIFLRFKGGKGVNTSLGAVMTLLPWETLIAVGVFFVFVLLFKYISLGSMLGACSLSVALLVEKFILDKPVAPVYLCLAAGLAAVILISHRQNIGRIIRGTENKFSLSSRTGKARSHV
jgi:glycerol-3-phosphate acyltransferase PlsY